MNTGSSSKMTQQSTKPIIEWQPYVTLLEQNNKLIALYGLFVHFICKSCHYYLWACFKDGLHYQQFRDKNFKQFLIICSQGVKNVWELQEVIYNAATTCGNLYYTADPSGCMV